MVLYTAGRRQWKWRVGAEACQISPAGRFLRLDTVAGAQATPIRRVVQRWARRTHTERREASKGWGRAVTSLRLQTSLSWCGNSPVRKVCAARRRKGRSRDDDRGTRSGHAAGVCGSMGPGQGAEEDEPSALGAHHTSTQGNADEPPPPGDDGRAPCADPPWPVVTGDDRSSLPPSRLAGQPRI